VIGIIGGWTRVRRVGLPGGLESDGENGDVVGGLLADQLGDEQFGGLEAVLLLGAGLSSAGGESNEVESGAGGSAPAWMTFHQASPMNTCSGALVLGCWSRSFTGLSPGLPEDMSDRGRGPSPLGTPGLTFGPNAALVL
jgi:hypothetical protein